MTLPLIFMVDDATCLSALVDVAHQAGYERLVATDELSLNKLWPNAPCLAVVDITATTFDWGRLVRSIRAPSKENTLLPVLGFGTSEVDNALEEKALGYGCTAVLGYANIVSQLPALFDKYRWQLSQTEANQPVPIQVNEAIRAFNEGKFFKAHALLEDVWLAEEGLLRVFYQGLIQLSVGYFHINQGKMRAAQRSLGRGIVRVGHFRPVCLGLDVAGLVQQAQTTWADLDAEGDIPTLTGISPQILTR